MRHSFIDLTANIYTDPTLPDVAGAVEMLPAPLPGMGVHAGEAIGTETCPTDRTRG